VKRLNWQTHLFSYLESCKTKRFEWGNFDCFIMCSEAIQAQTGTNPAKPFYGQYRSAKSVIKVLKKINKKSFTDIFSDQFELISPKLAQRGDIVAFQEPSLLKVGLAVCLGEYAMGLHPEKGLYPVEMKDWVSAWRIVA